MPQDPNSAVLRFEDVSVSFDGSEVLSEVSFAAYESESRVILGAAGSGKTVMLKTAMGLIKPDSGNVFVLGNEISRMPEQELFAIRSKIGMLFQESALFDSMTIEENVAYPLLNQESIQCPEDQVRLRVEEALEFVELGQTLELNKVLLYHSGAETLIGRPLVEGAKVIAEVIDELVTKKTMTQKFRRRKNYRRLKGHTQPYVRVKVTHILKAGEPTPSEAPKPAPAPAAS